MTAEPQGLLPPITWADVARDLRALGVREGDAVLAHSSLRRISGVMSMVLGGAPAVIAGLREAVGPNGLVAMPAFSADCSEPAHWTSPPVPSTWWPLIRETWPPFTPETTPTFRLGVIAETFRSTPGVVRSLHPQSSFAAVGPEARALTDGHPLERSLGEGSPLGKLYEIDARVVMIGTGWDTCTCFHLGEARMTPPLATLEQGAAVVRDGKRVWIEFNDERYDARDFSALGEAFERDAQIATGSVGRAPSRLFRLRDAVDFATRWLPKHRRRRPLV